MAAPAGKDMAERGGTVPAFFEILYLSGPEGRTTSPVYPAGVSLAKTKFDGLTSFGLFFAAWR